MHQPLGSSEHDDLMTRHQARKEIAWIPYHARRSSGLCDYAEQNSDACHLTTATIEVAGLGTLVLRAAARYDFVRNEYVWDEQCEMTGCLYDATLPDPGL